MKGDCASCAARPCLSVASKIAAPVVFEKSVSTIVSFSVSTGALLASQYQAPPATNTTTNAAAPMAFQLTNRAPLTCGVSLDATGVAVCCSLATGASSVAEADAD